MIEFSEHMDGTACWTCYPTESMPSSALPLTIAGMPVVIPVEHAVPLRAPLGSQTDPYPERLHPAHVVTKAVGSMIISHFRDALGFYLLLNGQLQIIVPPEFDYVWAYDQQPTEFGGLSVCYISADAVPRLSAHFGPSKPSPPTAHVSTREAWVKGSSRLGKKKLKPMNAQIGVRTRDSSGDVHFTIPTHLVAKALKYEKQSICFENMQNMSIYSDQEGTAEVRDPSILC